MRTLWNTEVPWICCQLGAREHYSVPRALDQVGALAELITDFWVTRAGRLYPRKVRERFHRQLAGATVKATNLAAILFEAQHAIAGPKGWELIVRRNDWFQEHALRELAHLAQRNPDQRFRLFSFSYTARRLFEFAKSRGWETILGQIDPGPPEERIVAGLHDRNAALAGRWQPAPQQYWQAWREECRLADRVLVNSAWSRRALLEEGVPEAKLRVVPLAYEPSVEAARFRRSYPDAFTPNRPLRVLFLGLVNLRKGMGAILESLRLLRNEPVEFWFVGPRQMELPTELLNRKNARWVGGVPRGEAQRYYQEADVFLFPSFSDGFGLTQLEAQAWKLPIIASRFCGEVVRHGVNGVLLEEVSGKAIAEAIRVVMGDPGYLRSMSCKAITPGDFSIEKLGSRLLGM